MNMTISLFRCERRSIRLLIICRFGAEKGSKEILDFLEGWNQPMETMI
ncbi:MULTISPECIES: hypothetical protein [unclassified Mesorhizobium]|nr:MULTISPECIES: hypothetical protein [unclassified Mesorhizobium]